MSERFGPRAHPGRCSEDMRESAEASREAYEQAHDQFLRDHPRRSIEESLGTLLGLVVLTALAVGVLFWWLG